MRFISLSILLFCFATTQAQELYQLPKNNARTHWYSFENPSGEKGKAAITNKGAKGSAWKYVEAGEKIILLNTQQPGTIRRIWMTLKDRSAKALKQTWIEMYWDDAAYPAVCVPLSDFFGIGLGKLTAFQSALFTSPEGRSFNCYIPMPFKKSARIALINKSNKKQTLFYDIDVLHGTPLNDDLYFHAYWNNNTNTILGKDFEILPKVIGKGRFLGCNITVVTDSSYKNTWWGEGEVKMYLDDDNKYPTLAGTGAEDYIGTGYGQGVFTHSYQGCTVADKEKGEWAFYRYHIPDPVYFYKNCKVTIQQMGGAPAKKVQEIYKAGAKLITVSSDNINFFEMEKPPLLTDNLFPEGWTNFYRLDKYTSTAYFYLNKPHSNLRCH